MSFNPLDSMKKFIDQSATSFNDSYNKVSDDIVKVVSPIVETVKPNVLIKSTQSTQLTESTKLTESEYLSQIVPYEKQFESSYIGCYEDDPLNPSMNTFVGNVSNISECIDLGKKNNFAYVGLRGGNECYASNNIPNTTTVNRYKNCNVGCDDIGTGNCGGFFYNQVYKTFSDMPNSSNNMTNEELEKEITTNTVDVLENFINSDNDMKKISLGLYNDNFNCWEPMNVYIMFFWLVILLLLIYVLFEYLMKKK